MWSYQTPGFGFAQMIPGVTALLGSLAPAFDAVEERASRLELAAQRIGDAFGKSFESVILDGKNAREAVEAFVKDVSRMIFRMLVTQTIARGITGAITGGLGGGSTAVPQTTSGALSHGGVVSSGIVTGPTFFPLRGGRTGLMGESGPEGVLPLARGANGRLGVEGGGGGSTTINQNFNITTPDTGGFKRSQRQILDDSRRGLRGLRGT